MPNSYRHLLYRADYKTTYMITTIQSHNQHLRVEQHSTADATTAISDPIVRGPVTMTTLALDESL